MEKNPQFDRFFREFKSDSKIFANYHLLTPEYNPNILIDRKTQIDAIWEELEYAFKHNILPQNFFLYGLPGTGKTLTIRYIIDKVKNWFNPSNTVIPIIFHNNCALFNTPYRILRELCSSIGIQIHRTGLSLQDVFSRFLDVFKNLKTNYLLLIFDELDFLFFNRRTANDLLYKIIRIPQTEANFPKISIFSITNDISLKESFDLRIKSSLNPKDIYFPPYSAIELQQILLQRIEAYKPDILDHGVIELIAANVAQNEGDARLALSIFRTAGELTEKAGESKVTKAYAKLAFKKFSEIQKMEIIQSLPWQSKKILEAIQKLHKKTYSFITGDVYNEYARLCQKSNYPILTFRQFNNHIKKLETLNLINTKRIHRGKGGNTRKITFYFS